MNGPIKLKFRSVAHEEAASQKREDSSSHHKSMCETAKLR